MKNKKSMLPNNFLIPFFLAFRYLTWSRAGSYVTFIVRLCFAGIMIGSASLCLTLMVMSGFEKQISQKARGMNSQAIIMSKTGKSLAWPEMGNLAKVKFRKFVEKVSATSNSQIVVDHGQNFYNLLLKAVDVSSFDGVSDLVSRITPVLEETGPDAKPRPARSVDLSKILHKNNVIIGHKIARNMGVKFGDEVKVMLPEPVGKKKVKLTESKVRVAGFLDVGFEEYDSSTIICSLELFWEFFGHQGLVDNVLIKFVSEQRPKRTGLFARIMTYLSELMPWSQDKEALMAKKLGVGLAGFKVQSWKQLYPALVSSMRLEKYAMFLILMLVSIVAIMNMISLLIVQVQAKRRDIAILRAMGFGPSQIRRVFVSLGLVITFFACLSGVLIAFGIGLACSTICPIKLPDAYLVANLPFDLAFEHFALVFIATMIVGFFASWIPARQASKLDVVQVLRGQ